MARAQTKRTKAPTLAQVKAAGQHALAVLAERDLHEFVLQAWRVVEPDRTFRDNWHIKAVCQHLEAVTAGRIKQLCVNVPPGTMKSLLVSVFWPAWVWTTKPAKRFMFSSYAETLSMRDSIKCRDLLTSAWYQARWPIMLKEDQNTKGRFDNTRRGWRIVGSVTGKGIGEHPDFNVADDPHNVLQAESDADRRNVTRWFEGVFCVRGEVVDVSRVLVMQRLHAKDCAGIAEDKGGWEFLSLPMQYEHDHPTATTEARPTSLGWFDPRREDGELLWPEVYTLEKVQNMEVNLGTYVAAGQLQQRPSPRGGGKFKRADFEVLTELPPGIMAKVRYWDKAGTKGGRGAESASVLMASYRCPEERLEALRVKYVILDAEAFRESAGERERIISQKAETDKATWGHVTTWVEQEPGSGGLESATNTIAANPRHAFKAERVTGSKEVRAEPLVSAASVRKVKILAGSWNEKLLGELEMFPVGKLKDLVDAASGAYNKLCVPSGAMGPGDFHAGRPSDQGDERSMTDMRSSRSLEELRI